MYLASLLVGSRTYTIFALIAPIISAFILYPDSFTLSWNEGRGGFLFVLIFIVYELLSNPKLTTSTRRLYIVCILSSFTIFYFVSLGLFGFQEVIKSSAGAFNVVLPDSWTWMWDFIVLASFLASALFILFGTRFLKVAPAAIIYLAGSAIILSLDAFFPYESLGPLQIIVPLYLEIDEAVINWVDKHIIDLGPGTPAAAEGNSLVLTGLNGPFALRVFWPSAGVHSLIIYSIVMLAFLLKMPLPMDRRVAYFVIGTFGTAVVNIVRIISLSFFPLLVTSNIQEWEGYHSVAGEVMFLPWLIVYLIIIMKVEQKTKLYVTNDSNNPN
jgi:thaumarchaeosortase